jgi:hypothetical protein
MVKKVDTIKEWYMQQSDYRVTIGIATVGPQNMCVHLYHIKEGLHMGVYNSFPEVLEAAYNHAHGIPKTFDAPAMRALLLEMEKNLAIQLGQPNITKRQQDVLGMMFLMAKDAIAAQIWKVQPDADTV